MATIDPEASLRASAEQRTEDFEGVPLEPETPNRKPIRVDTSNDLYYVHPNAKLASARELWRGGYPTSPLYTRDEPGNESRVRYELLQNDDPWAEVTVYEADKMAGLYWGEITGAVTDTFLGIVTDPDVLVRRAAELDLDHLR